MALSNMYTTMRVDDIEGVVFNPVQLNSKAETSNINESLRRQDGPGLSRVVPKCLWKTYKYLMSTMRQCTIN